MILQNQYSIYNGISQGFLQNHCYGDDLVIIEQKSNVKPFTKFKILTKVALEITFLSLLNTFQGFLYKSTVDFSILILVKL